MSTLFWFIVSPSFNIITVFHTLTTTTKLAEDASKDNDAKHTNDDKDNKIFSIRSFFCSQLRTKNSFLFPFNVQMFPNLVFSALSSLANMSPMSAKRSRTSSIGLPSLSEVSFSTNLKQKKNFSIQLWMFVRLPIGTDFFLLWFRYAWYRWPHGAQGLCLLVSDVTVQLDKLYQGVNIHHLVRYVW